MTALSAARNTPKKGSFPIPECVSVPVAASTKIYQGALVGINSSGHAVAGTSNASARIIGRARALADNSSGTAAAISVEVESGVFRYDNSATTGACTAADVGRPCFAVDDATVSRDSSNGARTVAGAVVEVDSSGVYVWLGFAQIPVVLEQTFIAAADLSSSGNVGVKIDTAGKVALCGAGEFAIGILQNAPVADALAVVRIAGISAMKADGTGVTRGDRISCAANGLGRATTSTATGLGATKTDDAGTALDPLLGANILGVALSTAAASAQFNVLLTLSGAVPGTVS